MLNKYGNDTSNSATLPVVTLHSLFPPIEDEAIQENQTHHRAVLSLSNPESMEEFQKVLPAPPSSGLPLTKDNTVFHHMFGITSPNSCVDVVKDSYGIECQSQQNDRVRDRGKEFEKVRVQGQGAHEILFHNNHLVQTVNFHHGSIWAAKFSPTGEYLCSGGEDMIVVVWVIGGSSATSTYSEGCSKPTSTRSFLCHQPLQVLHGHSGDVVDISWSCSNFILSASVDKTVRLWHVSRSDCIHVFRHPDIVTSVDFHPQCDWKFVSGCFDKRVRVWEIVPDPIIRQYCAVREIITATCYSPDGSLVVCGLVNGEIATCDATSSRMSILSRMHCRNSGGKHKAGRKVTSVSFLAYRQSSNHDKVSGIHESTVTTALSRHHIKHSSSSMTWDATDLLVTTNDHRIRRIGMDDRSIQCKYKGLSNSKMQIRATCSEDGNYIICGSDNGLVHIWTTDLPPRSSLLGHGFGFQHKSVNASYESFNVGGFDHISVNVALFVPSNSLIMAANTSPTLQSYHDFNNILSMLKLCSHSTKLSIHDAAVLIPSVSTSFNTSHNQQHNPYSRFVRTTLGTEQATEDQPSSSPSNQVTNAAKTAHISKSMARAVLDSIGNTCKRTIGNRSVTTAATAGSVCGGSSELLNDTQLEQIRIDYDIMYNCCSRAILTASADGAIRVFVRNLL